MRSILYIMLLLGIVTYGVPYFLDNSENSRITHSIDNVKEKVTNEWNENLDKLVNKEVKEKITNSFDDIKKKIVENDASKLYQASDKELNAILDLIKRVDIDDEEVMKILQNNLPNQKESITQQIEDNKGSGDLDPKEIRNEIEALIDSGKLTQEEIATARMLITKFEGVYQK